MRAVARRSQFAFVVLLATLLRCCLLLPICAVPVHAAELVDVVKVVEPSVVRVDTDSSIGSGVILGDQGIVLTNYHVIDSAREAKVQTRDGKSYPALGYLVIEPTHDLAVLRVKGLPTGRGMRLADSLPQVGEKVAAFGNPKGYDFTTSEGIVSALRDGKGAQQGIGETIYRSLGYSLDANWIQTTAAISPGNSGGPLVTMKSELVGLNTWGDPRGQQLNFAISLPDIKAVLAKVNSTTPVQHFTSLPQGRSMTIRPASPEDDSFHLKLPTGRVFTFEVFETRATRHMLADREGVKGTVVIAHPNGAIFANAQQQGGVLHGLTLAQYDNEKPMVEATYMNGRRHGILKTFDETGEPVLCCQYVDGRRNGFTVLFGESLEFIAQYKYDKLEYLQLMADLTPLEGFASQDAALKHPEAKQLLARLDQLDDELKKNEVQFRQQVKEFENDRRRELAGKLAPEKRARAAERARQRKAANDAAIEQIRRRANGG